ncbi:hypothetical protein KKD62_04330 [Patescibacteria group bacterium]|nr:hypothetical protein [Patescibacteria group bacterium]MBU1931311.1 hypothetical protein [Patescibacteria group bacterium]
MWFLAFLLIINLFLPHHVMAVVDPSVRPNNRYGIHVADTSELAEVADLVNSNGGDWGYVTLVIQDNDRDAHKWQTVFDQMRRLHLIPLLRLATHVDNASWLKPDPGEIDYWVEFLDSLNWPIKNRYVILFNEPNHAKEWGNQLDPESYADLLVDFSRQLKTRSEDFFILPAGLDFSAATNKESLDAAVFLRRMFLAQPALCQSIDGWTSHSYPNPNFSASPYDQGRGSLYGFNWELAFLNQLGCIRQLPVFITETGWQHRQGQNINRYLLAPQQVADYITIASQTVWQDKRLVAITPFIFSYQGGPFDHFSWKVLGAASYHPHYYAYQAIPKSKGQPQQEEHYSLASQLVPDYLVAHSLYRLNAGLINQGQAIIDQEQGYQLVFEDQAVGFSALIDRLSYIEPNQQENLTIYLKTPPEPGVYKVKVALQYNQEEFILEEKEVAILPPPSLSLKLNLGWRADKQAEQVAVLIYDQSESVVYEFTDQTIINGCLEIAQLFNIIPGEKYRVVALVPYYLPQQAITILSSGKTEVKFSRLLPLDFNQDGWLSFQDYWASFRLTPFKHWRLWF